MELHQDIQSQTLPMILDDFKSKFNDNPRAKKLVKRWDRLILLDPTDNQSAFGLQIHDQVLVDVVHSPKYEEGDDGLVHLQAEEAILKEIFAGKYNPATALTDGNLAVYSNDRDKVKLEALAMVIWRLG